jgi:hypothetical protein
MSITNRFRFCVNFVTPYYIPPNDLRMSRLADLAGYLPQTIVLGFKSVENTNEDTKPKAKSAPCACWAFGFKALLIHLCNIATKPFISRLNPNFS